MTLKQQLEALSTSQTKSAYREIKPGALEDVLVLLSLNLPELLPYGEGYFIREPYNHTNLIVWESNQQWMLDPYLLSDSKSLT